MDKKITGTIITLTYRNNNPEADIKSLQSVTESIEDQITNKEGLKIITNTTFGKGQRVHHHILINRKVEINLKAIWENGQSSIDYITDDDHYREAIKYVTC